ncbi:DNA primase [Candidatus Saccharibacteria bacterium]|nr:DNA primase [Candidatus Saccharibacteria bacterium]
MYDLKDEIKSRLPVEDVIGQYVELKRAGRNLKGRSPWGVDKTPSFMVSPEKGIWHDFSANKGGDIFTFVMEVEGIPFKEALEKLARQAGVDISKYGGTSSGSSQKVQRKKARLKEALNLSTRYYQACLAHSREVCEYVFYKRNLNRATVSEFKIGYSPENGHALIDVLKKRGFTLEELDSAGLLNRFKKDLFRHRMMIPFFDTDGSIIGYTARIIGAGEPKYLNTPETILFNKSRFIFGLFQAKEAIRRNGFVVIVEGNMDVISSHQAGVKETVATSGTAMTPQHLKILSRLTSDIRLAYDGDAAGVKATERAVELAGELGIDLTIISNYHGAKDPDELIQKDPALWQAAVEERIPAVDWLLNKYAESLNLNLAPDKRKYSDLALHLLNLVKDEIERATYEQKIAKTLGVTVEALREKGDRLNRQLEESASRKYLKKPKTEVVPDHLKRLEDTLLSLKVFGGITKTNIPFPLPENETKLSELELIFNTNYEEMKNVDYEKEAAALMKRYEKESKKAKIASLQEKLESLPEDDPSFNDTLSELNQLLKAKSLE